MTSGEKFHPYLRIYVYAPEFEMLRNFLLCFTYLTFLAICVIGRKLDVDTWSSWSAWTTCSRSCGGGITFSLRTCSSVSKNKRLLCIGEPMRRRICNTKPCLNQKDSREAQCSAYDAVPYRGKTYQWLPFYDSDDPCSLTCQAKGYNFVAKLSAKVQDGTRCREGALDMCIEGFCTTVGCDLEVGSTKKVDECGVCGGDGSSCTSSTKFVWSHRDFDPCPVTCGGAIQVAAISCTRKETGSLMDFRLCDLSLQPKEKTQPCNTNPCPAVWSADEWEICSVSCGSGVQKRTVNCVQGGPNGTQVQVPNEFCPLLKPKEEKACVLQECPQWFQGVWSACSSTCGQGLQRRAVVCRDGKSLYSEDCESKAKPDVERACEGTSDCIEPPSQTEPPPCVTETTESIESLSLTEMEHTSFTESPTLTETPLVSSTFEEPTRTEVSGEYYYGPWGPCNTTCGNGYRHRLVECRLILNVITTPLPESHCQGRLSPPAVEYCAVHCNTTATTSSSEEEEILTPETEEKITDETTTAIAFTTAAYSPCVIFCQEGASVSVNLLTRVICGAQLVDGIGDHDSGKKCEEVKSLPTPKPKTTCDSDRGKCNIVPPTNVPGWKVSPFGECTLTCGGGWRTRKVHCVSPSDVVLPPERCPMDQPEKQEQCNTIDCPAKWKAEPWSKCSKSCGGGFQTRKLRCEMEVGFNGEIVPMPPSRCTRARPKASKVCNKKQCRRTNSNHEPFQSESFLNHISGDDVKQLYSRRVMTKAEGRIAVFKGSTVKIQCPAEHGNSTSILWFKGRSRISWPSEHAKSKAGRLTISPSGSLKIRNVNFSDAATYTCLAGPFRSDLELEVTPEKPKEFDP